MNEYEIKAEEFLKKNNIRFSVLRTTVEKAWDDKSHYCHYVRFYNRKTKKSMSLKFFTSLQDFWDCNEECSAYDVLSCIQKYDVGTIDDFVSSATSSVLGKMSKRQRRLTKPLCVNTKVCKEFSVTV